jgi:hypothetical protein
MNSQQKQIVREVTRSYYEANRQYGDLTAAYDTAQIMPLAAAALAAAGESADAEALTTEIEGNILTGAYKIATDNDLFVYLFFAGMAVCIYYYFKYKIKKQ